MLRSRLERAARQGDKGNAAREQRLGILAYRIVRRRLDHGFGSRRNQLLETDDERHAKGLGQRPALGLRASPSDGYNLHVAQCSLPQVFEDQARDHAAADDADAHACPAVGLSPSLRFCHSRHGTTLEEDP